MRASEVFTKPLQFQFALRDLLAWTWCAGAISASLRGGLSSLLVFGIPLSLVGYQAIARANDLRWPGWRPLAQRCWSVVGCAGLLALILSCGVRPLGAAGGMALAGGVLWSLALVSAKRRAWRVLAPAPLLVFVYLLLCVAWPQRMERFIRGVPGSVLLQDVRGGRNGIQLLFDFSYTWPGANTALIESYLGPVEPEWEGQWYLSQGYAGSEERVNRQSILRKTDLPDILALLPSDAARRQALACMTNPKNLARVHQGLLLVSLKTFGYPDGENAEGWWKRHAADFRAVENADEAAKLVFGWRVEIAKLLTADEAPAPDSPQFAVWQQLDAALNQELGMWGGDDDFSEAYHAAGIRQRDFPAASSGR